MKRSDQTSRCGAAVSQLVAAACGLMLVSSAMGQVKLETANLPGALPFVQQDRWGVSRSVVVNPGDSEAEALVRVNIAQEGGAGFASRVWLPPQSRRVVNTPIRVTGGSASANRVTLQTTLMTEVAGQARVEGPTEASVLQRGGPFNVVIVGGDDASGAFDLIAELRSASGLSPGIGGVASRDLPWSIEGYDSLDGLVLAERSPQLNSSQYAALRGWVREGGRVWLMLDKVDPAWALSAFGDVVDVAVLGEDDLNTFAIRDADADERWLYHADDTCRLLHVDLSGAQTLQWVGGSPVAARFDFGHGRVMVTMLSPQGWLSGPSSRQAIVPLMSFVEGQRIEHPDVAGLMANFTPYVTQQMGYQVVGRGWIVLAFGVLVAMILLAVVVLRRWHRLEWVGPVGVVAGAGVAAVIVLGGMAGRKELGSKVWRAQLIDIEADHARVSESVNVYRAAGDPTRQITPTMREGGLLLPASGDAQGAAPVVWTDPQTSSLPDLELRADAAQRFLAESTVDLPLSPRALVSFDATGAAVQVQGMALADGTGPIVLSPSGALALNPSESGWAGGLSQVMLPGQFSSSTLMSDTDVARQSVLRGLMQDPAIVRSPRLACWTTPLDTPLHLSMAGEAGGGALALLPVEFVAATAGGAITIPWPFIAMTPYRGPLDGRAFGTAIYDPESREWIAEVQQSMRVVMRFELPEGYRSMVADSLSLSIDVRAPGREIDVFVVDGGRSRSVVSMSDALGRQNLELTGEDVPSVSADGAIVIGLDVGEFADPLKPRSWSIQGMELSVKGSVR